jgi:alcohol dehydrogenase class IV
MIALKAISLISRSIRRAFNRWHRHRRAPRHAARRDVRRHVHRHLVDDGGACLAYPLGGKYRIAHGVSNAILLPFVMRFNAVGNEPTSSATSRWRWGSTSIRPL